MKIDLVYLWIDGSDPEWRKMKNAWLPADRQLDVQTAGDCRYTSNDELKYSLRSVVRYAPWVRRIYIVTNDQTPTWLDTSNPRVQVIFQKEIMPAWSAPVFNSCAVELYLHCIPGLSEHFLYANDDMLFGAPVAPSFFFDAAGRPVVRLVRQHIRGKKDTYARTIYRAQMLVRERFGKYYPLAPHHNIDAYRKSDFAAALDEFHAEALETTRHRFRTPEDLQRAVILYHALATGRATMRRVGRYNRVTGLGEAIGCFLRNSFRTDARCMPLTTPDFMRTLHKYNPALFAVNDGEGATPADRQRVKCFLETLFPEPSEFEK